MRRKRRERRERREMRERGLLRQQFKYTVEIYRCKKARKLRIHHNLFAHRSQLFSQCTTFVTMRFKAFSR